MSRLIPSNKGLSQLLEIVSKSPDTHRVFMELHEGYYDYESKPFAPMPEDSAEWKGISIRASVFVNWGNQPALAFVTRPHKSIVESEVVFDLQSLTLIDTIRVSELNLTNDILIRQKLPISWTLRPHANLPLVVSQVSVEFVEPPKPITVDIKLGIDPIDPSPCPACNGEGNTMVVLNSVSFPTVCSECGGLGKNLKENYTTLGPLHKTK